MQDGRLARQVNVAITVWAGVSKNLRKDRHRHAEDFRSETVTQRSTHCGNFGHAQIH